MINKMAGAIWRQPARYLEQAMSAFKKSIGCRQRLVSLTMGLVIGHAVWQRGCVFMKVAGFWSASSVSLLIVALGCGPRPESDERPVLRIASDATFAPFHFVDEYGVVTGFEPELARLVAERAGFRPEVYEVPYEYLFTGLDREHDVVAATTGITEERERDYLVTTSYFRTCQAALVRVGTGEPQSMGELRGRPVGAAGSGTSAAALKRLTDVDRVSLGEEQEGVPSLLDGTIDALVVDEFDAVNAALDSGGRLRVLAKPVALESYGFVLARGQESLRDALDRALAELEAEGAVSALQNQFGVVRNEDWPVRLAH